ncbi:MAG TPA: tyrosine-type recombinase/integrase [Phycisphaerae bacterium]|nr:tyrosine-type recombinase/integrase [Phycisphaerae bacterium]
MAHTIVEAMENALERAKENRERPPGPTKSTEPNPLPAIVEAMNSALNRAKESSRRHAARRKERPGFRLFKPTYQDRDGARREASKWYAEFRDAMEKIRRIPLFTDERQSHKAAENIVGIVADVQNGGRLTDAALLTWVRGIPGRLVDALANIGLLESTRLAARKPMKDHIADFRDSMSARSAKHRGNTTRLVERIVAAGKIADVNGITPSAVDSGLAAIREPGRSVRTVNKAATAMKAFTRWLVRDGRLATDPIQHLKSANADTDPRHVRREFEDDDLARLIEAAGRSPVLLGLTGDDRAMLYRVAVGTGFRAAELFSLTPESFDLASNPPTVAVEAAYSKRRRRDEQPIRPDLADRLAPWLRQRAAGEAVWPITCARKTAEMIRADLEAAGVAYADDAGRVLDFHALRHTYVSRLVSSGRA